MEMLDKLKRYAGLDDDCPPDDPPAGDPPGDSLLGAPTKAGGDDPDDDPPPRYCYRPPSPPLKRALKITLGSVLLMVGIVMFVTPGPAIIVIPVALGILASEIPWLRRHIHALRLRIHEYRMRRKRERRAREQAEKIK
jgi:hypothetical protein